MEELYTDEVRDADRERSRQILAAMPERDRLIAAELMSISFRSGVAAGKAQAASLALLWA